MFVVPASRFNRSTTEQTGFQPVFTAEASDLALAPGHWPDAIHVRNSDGRIGRFGAPVALYSGRGEDRELAAVVYHGVSARLKVWND